MDINSDCSGSPSESIDSQHLAKVLQYRDLFVDGTIDNNEVKENTLWKKTKSKVWRERLKRIQEIFLT